VSIHPSSIVAPGVLVPDSCTIGPFCTIGPDVVLGEGNTLISHVVLDGHTRIGARNVFHPFCAIGVAPQDLKYGGEPTQVEIGDDNTIRESVTISRGTHHGSGITRIGSGNLLMAYAHIGHDCEVGSHCILANCATLAGHVTIEDYAIVEAFSGVHQFCRIGQHSFVGGYSVLTKDVLPFSQTVTPRESRVFGENKVGLKRRGFSDESIAALHKAFRLLTSDTLNTTQALDQIEAEIAPCPELATLVAFIRSAQRGFIK